MSKSSAATPREIKDAVQRCRAAFVGVGVFSGVLNVLALTGSIYMLQVYDRVIPSRSVPTLIGLTILMLALYLAHGFLDVVRTRIMSRIGLRFDRALRDRIYATVMLLPLRYRAGNEGAMLVRDLDQVRNFLSSAGPTALFDLPWLPLYLALIFLMHPWLGWLGVAGAVILVVLTLLTEALTREPTNAAQISGVQRQALVDSTRRNAESIRAMGMGPRLQDQWSLLCERHANESLAASDRIVVFGTMSRSMRMVLQSLMLGLGAYLVVVGQATAGVMIAASIILSRALSPIEIAIANWRGFIAARQSFARMKAMLDSVSRDADVLELPQPSKGISVEGISLAAPGDTRAILNNVSFRLAAGDGLGIIGQSGCGKSSLARALVGAWIAQRGFVRLDGAPLDKWRPEVLGRHIGYLPQGIELFDGTVAQNISRLEPEADSNKILAAAQAAGLHETILRLPNGYETRVGDGGSALSAGQRQRVGLARALYGDPFLVVLDEPNSNLDGDGEAALTAAIRSVRQRRGIVIVIAHRPSAIEAVDKLMLMQDGAVTDFGTKDDVRKRLAEAQAARQKPAQAGDPRASPSPAAPPQPVPMIAARSESSAQAGPQAGPQTGPMSDGGPPSGPAVVPPRRPIVSAQGGLPIKRPERR